MITATLQENLTLADLEKMTPAEIAELITEQPDTKEKLVLFQKMPFSLSVRVFEMLSFPLQKELINALLPEQAAAILKEMSPDDRTAFLGELPNASVNELLKLLPVKERTIALKLLGYPENSVGRLMTTDYLTVKLDWTIQEVLDSIRLKGHDSETIDVIYVVDDHGKLIDDLRIRELLLANPKAKVAEIADNKFLSLSATDEDEQAINKFLGYDRGALPVIDKQGLLMGIVTIDDVLNLSSQEHTEDVQRIGGTTALEEPYMDTPFFQLMRKRANWLVILFLGEMLTATAMGYFQDELSKAIVLALFIPLIISSGGNSGSQASTLIIRALAVGEVTLKDWWRIMRREVLSGLFLGTILGLIGFFRVSLWSLFTSIYGMHWMLVALTVFAALIGVVLWGTVAGSMTPLVLRKLGFDPAVASAPLIATLVDVTGLIIYFGIALIILNGTLL